MSREVERVGLLPTRRRKAADTRDLTTLLHAAKAGDTEARERMLHEYTPYILKIASQAAHRYIDRQTDDEFSIALSAFNEAIDSYDPERSNGFLALAETIIKRRLIDEHRRQQRSVQGNPWSDFEVSDEENNVMNYVEIRSSLEDYAKEQEAAARSYEIEEYERELQLFKLSFSALIKVCPKHEDARQNAIAVAKMIVRDDHLLSYVRQKKSLPMKELEQLTTVSRKTLERQRKYILAVVLLLAGDYPYLQSYVAGVSDGD
ncbi:RNA polymerase sigma-I factor [Alicyclobacillus tolerans]|uniref:RNA polymerase sigma-I factor n=1 Tax=Alicyclobacillus tolerans TaxID=90970 RepID=UPI001F6110B8|nr:RNA polymerase sigma-I factor [Alicyclobacillus montanus]